MAWVNRASGFFHGLVQGDDKAVIKLKDAAEAFQESKGVVLSASEAGRCVPSHGRAENESSASA